MHRQFAAGMAGEVSTARFVRRHSLLLLIVLLVLALVGAAFAVALFVLVKTADDAAEPARAAVVTFVGHLKAGDTDTAHAQLCAATRARYDAAAFADVVQGRKRIMDGRPTTFTSDSTGRASYDVLFAYADGTDEVRTIPLVMEEGVYKICGDPY